MTDTPTNKPVDDEDDRDEHGNRLYHIALASGDERHLRADEVTVLPSGALMLHDADTVCVAAHAGGQWLVCERERPGNQ